MLRLLSIIISAVWINLLLLACANEFEIRIIDQGIMLVGNRLAVEKECIHRGVVPTNPDISILGCTDFTTKTIVTIDNEAIIAHELCHLVNWTESHEVCPEPLWREE